MGRPPGSTGSSRLKLLDAARALFAQHGVHGTSLQMIADHLGVTKAAVYHQFKSKDEIVLATAEPAIEQLRSLVEEASMQPTRASRFDATVTGLVELVLDHRDFAATLPRDPEMTRLLRSDERYQRHTARMDALLIGHRPSAEARVALAAAGGGLMVAGIDPSLDGVDRETMRSTLTRYVHAVLGPYASSAPEQAEA
ncbi:TetR/AcrR family transcriptional regulator [Rathayibacter sp. VKM Ac-2760]|uniref:TetR/AcrR family transcriptional regulator n=1 Tax=Rathayibacter sp. VKM Ac-2760 TaxID=2609253 RepID=UPI00131913AB|nr:TetR/AcrR family transcriptional regulator [Rathayibacter sp. VKM Ac-2760]QHC61063.1 TetR family transcriptional regulator [Rathayibacter sp. VKM Ac-2760]